MGCDGGTIPRRDELVKTKKKPEAIEKDIQHSAKWKYCALTQKELKQPIVACELGQIYNKDSIIEYLLDKETTIEKVSHIKNLKDLCTLNLKLNPASEKPQNGNEYVNLNVSPYICPVIGLEMNGKYKFVLFWKCGCVMSDRALKEVNSKVCIFCNKPSDPCDIVALNPDDSDLERVIAQMQERRSKAKKNKKRKAEHTVTSEVTKKAKSDSEAATSSADKPPSTSGPSKPKDKFITDLTTQSLLTGKAAAKYQISKDPKATEAFKSLFTTHENAKRKPKMHWVTHNPCFY